MYELIIIFSFSANCFASFVGFTLNAISTALEAFAKVTSVSVIIPMSDKIIFGLTSSCFIWEIAPLIASDEPWTSDFTIIFSSSETLSLKADSCVTKLNGFFPSLNSCNLASHKDFASFSESKTKKSSPDFAAPLIPSISIGEAGWASSIFLPWSFIIALTFPHCNPLTKKSPFFKVPDVIIIFATGPLPISIFDSKTTAVALDS